MVFAITWWFFKEKKEWAGMWMVVITFVNCATDDMLDIQSGIVFFLFFISLLYWGSRKQYESAYQALYRITLQNKHLLFLLNSPLVPSLLHQGIL